MAVLCMEERWGPMEGSMEERAEEESGGRKGGLLWNGGGHGKKG